MCMLKRPPMQVSVLKWQPNLNSLIHQQIIHVLDCWPYNTRWKQKFGVVINFKYMWNVHNIWLVSKTLVICKSNPLKLKSNMYRNQFDKLILITLKSPVWVSPSCIWWGGDPTTFSTQSAWLRQENLCLHWIKLLFTLLLESPCPWNGVTVAT